MLVFIHFRVALRTTPMDSTGVPHILEHTTLCGSKNYPVRDPFFKMLTRSLNTFMNAFTGYIAFVCIVMNYDIRSITCRQIIWSKCSMF